jgi:cellulose synthase/poly-beta-1,6-N-acetylglucosamine synthase-like glycosyltransferase
VTASIEEVTTSIKVSTLIISCVTFGGVIAVIPSAFSTIFPSLGTTCALCCSAFFLAASSFSFFSFSFLLSASSFSSYSFFFFSSFCCFFSSASAFSFFFISNLFSISAILSSSTFSAFLLSSTSASKRFLSASSALVLASRAATNCLASLYSWATRRSSVSRAS